MQKSQISKSFLYYIAIRDVMRCRFARRLQTGLQRCKFCKVQSQSERSLGSKSSVANLVDPARHLLATLLLYCENPAIFSTEALKRGFLCFCYQTEQRKDNAILLSHIFQPTPQNYWFPILKVKFEILPFFNNFYMKSHLLIIF